MSRIFPQNICLYTVGRVSKNTGLDWEEWKKEKQTNKIFACWLGEVGIKKKT